MARRTTPPRVEAIIETDVDISLEGFIETATALVDWLVGEDSDGVLTATLLERIECFLAAHFYAHRDQLYTSKSAGGASSSFQGQFGMRLESTQYGQTALTLDVTGALQDLQKGDRPKAYVKWVGKPVSSQIDYEDRD